MTNKSEKQNFEHFKMKLEEEQATLEKELSTVGRKNPSNPEDWEATPTDMEVSKSDENETADSIEEFEENSAILKQLEIRLGEVKKALQRIADGTYGVCKIGKEPIEHERLEANPAADTCEKHMGK